MRNWRALAIAAVLTTGLPSPLRAQGGGEVALSFQGRARQYLLHVPPSPNGALVLAFHGGGQFADQMRYVSRLDAIADREHFIVAYPQAFERSWADGRGVTAAEKQGVDDIGFAKAVVADIARTHTIDRGRVFATGLSNGGIFAHRLGCEAADTFVAIAPVIAAITSGVAASCRPSAPVSVISIVGLDDPSIAFAGGAIGGVEPGGRELGSRATEEVWRSINGCAPAVTSTPLPVLVQDGTSVNRRSYSSCRADVVWYEIQGGGHRWPPHREEGAQEALSRRENGVSSQNINASETIWAFFAAHPRR